MCFKIFYLIPHKLIVLKLNWYNVKLGMVNQSLYKKYESKHKCCNNSRMHGHLLVTNNHQKQNAALSDK